MKVAAYQAPLLRSGSLDALALIAAQVRCCESAGVEILCCPEAVLGGLADQTSRPGDLAISTASRQFQALLAPLDSDTVTTIVGFTEAGPSGRLFNSAAIVSRGRLAGVYRKMHPAIRRSVYEPGTAAPVFRAGELTFGIVICRDSTYPELVRSLAHRGAVALFVPTNNALPPSKGGPEIVEQARRTDLSLATENGLAVIRADVAGRLDGLESYGSSWIIENSGVTLRAARQLEPDLVVAEIQIQCRSGRYNPQGSAARPKPSPQAFAGSIIMSTRSTTLVEFLAAVVADDATAVRLVGATPQIAQARAVDERLVKEIPHQVYAGDTALHLAAAALRPLTVGALIRAGADSNAVNRRGATALHYACDARPRAGGTWNPSKQRSVIELLLDAGADVEHKDKAGAVPLHRAVRARSPEAVRCLLERGARVDATHGRQRTTPLHIGTRSTGASGTKGAQAEQQEIVGLLLEYGANPRARDANGTLPRIRA